MTTFRRHRRIYIIVHSLATLFDYISVGRSTKCAETTLFAVRLEKCRVANVLQMGRRFRLSLKTDKEELDESSEQVEQFGRYILPVSFWTNEHGLTLMMSPACPDW